jgi:hypothetical protein
MSNTEPASPPQAFDWRAHLKVHPAAELFPLLSNTELKDLADDIQANGLRTQIVLSAEDDALIDGRNRLDALTLLGLLCVDEHGRLVTTKLWSGEKWVIDDSPCEIRLRREKGDPYVLALSYNVHRRHLDIEERQKLIIEVIARSPSKSNRQIGKEIGVTDKTVARARTKGEELRSIPQLNKTQGKDGKFRPARKPSKPKAADTITRGFADAGVVTKGVDLGEVKRGFDIGPVSRGTKQVAVAGNAVEPEASAEARKAAHATGEGNVVPLMTEKLVKLPTWVINYVARIRDELGCHHRDHAAEMSILCGALRELISEFEDRHALH